MNIKEAPHQTSKVRNRRVHMANKRTFLAWIRTSIAITAFGFVIERFALFVRQLTILAGKEGHLRTELQQSSASFWWPRRYLWESSPFSATGT